MVLITQIIITQEDKYSIEDKPYADKFIIAVVKHQRMPYAAPVIPESAVVSVIPAIHA